MANLLWNRNFPAPLKRGASDEDMCEDLSNAASADSSDELDEGLDQEVDRDSLLAQGDDSNDQSEDGAKAWERQWTMWDPAREPGPVISQPKRINAVRKGLPASSYNFNMPNTARPGLAQSTPLTTKVTRAATTLEFRPREPAPSSSSSSHTRTRSAIDRHSSEGMDLGFRESASEVEPKAEITPLSTPTSTDRPKEKEKVEEKEKEKNRERINAKEKEKDHKEKDKEHKDKDKDKDREHKEKEKEKEKEKSKWAQAVNKFFRRSRPKKKPDKDKIKTKKEASMTSSTKSSESPMEDTSSTPGLEKVLQAELAKSDLNKSPPAIFKVAKKPSRRSEDEPEGESETEEMVPLAPQHRPSTVSSSQSDDIFDHFPVLPSTYEAKADLRTRDYSEPADDSGHFSASLRLVVENSSKKYFAMKVINRTRANQTDMLRHVRREVDIVRRVRHAFIADFHGVYTDRQHATLRILYTYPLGHSLLMTMLDCGGAFSESVARFYASEIVLALEYLHSLGISYRDLKPETITIAHDGHVLLHDFHFACEMEWSQKRYSVCGTPGYMAPEMLMGVGYTSVIDWWSFGILVFEMHAGYPPFVSTTQTDLDVLENITVGRIHYPDFFTHPCKSLVCALLQPASSRLGNGALGPWEVKNHPYFSEVPWVELQSKRVNAPHPADSSQSNESLWRVNPLPETSSFTSSHPALISDRSETQNASSTETQNASSTADSSPIPVPVKLPSPIQQGAPNPPLQPSQPKLDLKRHASPLELDSYRFTSASSRSSLDPIAESSPFASNRPAEGPVKKYFPPSPPQTRSITAFRAQRNAMNVSVATAQRGKRNGWQ